MSGTVVEILAILLLVIINGALAMAEMAVVSSRKARLQQLAAEGDRAAAEALDLINDPGVFLSTVQVGITLVGILAGALGGATIAEELEIVLKELPVVGPYAAALGIAVVVVSVTYLSMVLGELLPKRLALSNPERIARFVAAPLKFLSVISRPAVYIVNASTNQMLRLLRIGPSREPPVTEAEIQVLVDEAAKAGVVEQAEKEMLAGILSLGDMRVSAIMTPRPDVVWLDPSASAHEMVDKMMTHPHYRFPVARGDLHNLLGIVDSKEILLEWARHKQIDWEKHVTHPLYVPESKNVLALLDLFKTSGKQIAVVVDEFGTIEGLVTIDDVLQAIVGKLPIAGHLEEPVAVRREDGSWLVDGMISIAEFKKLFEIKELPDEESGVYQTLAGFILTYLEHVPEEGESFEWEGFRFEVVDMDRHRIDKVLVNRIAGSGDSGV